MKKIFIFLMIVSLSFLATSCYYDELPVVPIPENVSYQEDVQSIWKKNCIVCHKAGATEPDLTTGNSYTSLMSLGSIIPGNANDSEFMGMLKKEDGSDNPMPPNGALSASELAIVEKWINDGALNN